MTPDLQKKIIKYVEQNISIFHKNRVERLKSLKLQKVIKRKNPYLFKVKNISTASGFIENILEAYLSSQEETLFGTFLENLAIFICNDILKGYKSSAEGIDLEFEKNEARYIVSIKSGPNWGNSSQINKMKDNFRKAKKIIGTNQTSSPRVIAVNGCCYGQDSKPDKGEYLKYCGQKFWHLISDDPNLYKDIIIPLGHKAKEKNEEFFEEYAKVINKFTQEFIVSFCDDTGAIDWRNVVKFNSSSSD
jgi:hypothetical protein